MKKLPIISLIALSGTALTSCQQDNNGNSEMDAYVSKLMGQMTLEEKIGQLNLVSNWM